MEIRLIYMTAGSREEAETIGRALVAERLVACVNVIDRMHAFYWWEGRVQEDTELVLLAKTTEDKVPAVVDRVRKLHSYECPCVVSLPVTGGHRAFLEWVAAETATS